MNFFSNIISGVTNFFTPQAPSAPPVSSFSNPVVTESVARVRDFVAPMLEKPTFSFTYQPSNVGANRVYSAATAKAPAAPAPQYDEYVAPSIGPAKLPADLRTPLTGSVVNMHVQQRAYDGLGSKMSLLEKAREAGYAPSFDAERLLYDPGAGARYLREAGKVPLLFDYVPISEPSTYLEKNATQMGAVTRGLRDAAAVGYLAPGLPAASSAVGKIGNLTLSGVGYGAALETLNLPWDTPIAERLDKTAAAGVAGGVFGAGIGTAIYGTAVVKQGVGRVAHNLVPSRTYNLKNDFLTLKRTGWNGVLENILADKGVQRTMELVPNQEAGGLSMSSRMRAGVNKADIYRQPMARLMWNRPQIGDGLAKYYTKNPNGTFSLTAENPARLSVLDSLIMEGGAYGGRDPHVMGAFFSKATPKGVQYFDNFGIGLNPGEWASLFGKGKASMSTWGRAELAARALMSKFTSPPNIEGVIPWSEVDDYLNYVSSCKPGYFDSAALQALQRAAQEGALRELGPTYMMQRARSSPPVWEAFEGGFTLPPWR